MKYSDLALITIMEDGEFYTISDETTVFYFENIVDENNKLIPHIKEAVYDGYDCFLHYELVLNNNYAYTIEEITLNNLDVSSVHFHNKHFEVVFSGGQIVENKWHKRILI